MSYSKSFYDNNLHLNTSYCLEYDPYLVLFKKIAIYMEITHIKSK